MVSVGGNLRNGRNAGFQFELQEQARQDELELRLPELSKFNFILLTS